MYTLMIVDMLQGFTRVGPLASPRVAALIPKHVEFIRNLHKTGKLASIIFACDLHDPLDPELKRMPPHCMRGTEEAKVCPEIYQAALDTKVPMLFIDKKTHSAFFQTQLDTIYKPGSPDWILIGCVTDICISANVAELDYRGYNSILPRDLIDTYDIPKEVAEKTLENPAKEHDAELFNRIWFDYYLPGVWGAKVVQSTDLAPVHRGSRKDEDGTIRVCLDMSNRPSRQSVQEALKKIAINPTDEDPADAPL